jgi:hypothetical protein
VQKVSEVLHLAKGRPVPGPRCIPGSTGLDRCVCLRIRYSLSNGESRFRRVDSSLGASGLLGGGCDKEGHGARQV